MLIFLLGIYLLSLLFGGRREEPSPTTTKEGPPKIVASTESGRPTPTKPTPVTTKRDIDPPEPEITSPKSKPVDPPKEMPKEDEKPSPKVVQPSPKIVEPIPKKPARSGVLILRLREPARRGAIPFLEVDGKKVADWVEDTRSLTAIIESGSRQIAVKIPDGVTDRVLMDRTMDVSPDKRTEVDVPAGK